jgi:anti-anti-sigma factor
VSGVVYLPPRPKKQRMRSALASLRSVIRGSALVRGRWWRAVAAADPPSSDRDPRRVQPITADGARAVRDRLARGTLGLNRRRAHGQHILELSGELSLRTRDPLARALEQALEDDCEEIILDLGDLDTVDRAGLHTILVAHMRASDELKPLVLVPGPPEVQRVLDAAAVPFTYTAPRASPGAWSQGRRTRPSPRAGRRRTRPPSARRTH